MADELWTSSQLALQETTVQAIIDDTPRYGWGRFRPNCLQKFRNTKWLLFWLCWAGAVQGMVVNGFVNVMITTIEKRFGLKSTDTGLVAGAYDLASFLCLVPVSYFGGNGNKPRWLGWGVAIMGLGSLLFALPHAVIGPYKLPSSKYSGTSITTEGCLNETTTCDIGHGPVIGNFKYVFFTAQLLHGAGATPLYTLGVTFLDESVPTKMSSVYIGIFYAMAIFGPAIGYLVGGQLLKVYVDIDKFELPLNDLTPSSSLWVGAWWIGFIISGICSLLIAVPLLGFPPQLPGWKEIRLGKVSEARLKVSHLDTINQIGFGSSIGHLPRSLKILASNPTFIFLSLAGAFEIMLLNGFAAFLPKFFEAQFNLTSSKAAFLVGLVTVTAGGGGTLLGGYVIKRCSLRCAGIIRLCTGLTAAALVTCFVFLTNCPNIPFAGINYNDTGCSLSCSCSNSHYDPVCGSNGVTYFSPCFAGCFYSSSAENQLVFANCSCVTPPLSSLSVSTNSNFIREVKKESCSSQCNYMPVFLVMTFIFAALTFTASMPALSATLRCVDEHQKSFALGVQWMVARLLGSIPAPVLFGACIDLSCVLWQSQCKTDHGYCRLYDNYLMSRSMFAISVSAKVIATVCFGVAMFVYKPPDSATSSAENTTVNVNTVSSNVPYRINS
ncbi:hypothetical protein CHUAL_000530 [Chamberlinius hualienensis]